MEFKDNPFYILDASLHDSKSIIHEKAENKSFELSEEICRNAERILVNPKRRLEAEIGWFPGISQRLINEINKPHARITYRRVIATINEIYNKIPILTCANIIALFMSQIEDKSPNLDDINKLFHFFFQIVNKLESSLSDTIKIINSERNTSGFPEIHLDEYFNELIEKQISLYCYISKFLLKSFEFKYRLDIITKLVESETSNGSITCDSEIFINLIKDYEFDSEVISILREKETEIDMKIDDLSMSIKHNAFEFFVLDIVEKLKSYVLEWDKIAQPIQLFYRSQGKEHESSRELFYKLRAISIDFFKKYKNIKSIQELTELQKKVFAESREASEKLTKDEDDLQRIILNNEERKKMEYYNEWVYIFKYSVKISYNKIVVNKTITCMFEEATGIRYGLTLKYKNGLQIGTQYVVSIEKASTIIEVPIRDDKMFNDVVNRLLQSIGVNILSHYIELFKDGRYIIIGGHKIYDDGMELNKSKYLFMSEIIRVSWNEINSCYSHNGCLIVEGKKNNIRASFSYQEVFNAHILEIMLNTLLKKRATSISKAFSG